MQTYLNNTTGADGFFKTYGLSTNYIQKVDVTGDETKRSDEGKDYVFLLSKAEVEGSTYFKDASERIAKYEGTALNWWTRTPESDSEGNSKIYCVTDTGNFEAKVYSTSWEGVRPAFWYKWK